MSKALYFLLASLLMTSARGQVFIGNGDLAGSTVDVEVVASSSGTAGTGDNIPVAGAVNLTATSSLGIFTGVTLTGGAFTVADTAIPLFGGLATLSSSGLGFTVRPSTFVLSPLGGDDYSISGDLLLTSDTGTAEVVENFLSQQVFFKDFSLNPTDYSAPLLNTSVITLTENGSVFDAVGQLRFGNVTLSTYNAGTETVDILVSSENTITVTGELAPIPEPSVVIGLVSALGAVLLRRRRG